jgi:hypothetical protein
MHMHILPNHNSYSLVWMAFGVIAAPSAVIAILFLVARFV